MNKSILTLIALLLLNLNCLQSQFDPVLAARLQFILDSLGWSYQGVTASAYVPGEGFWSGASGISHGNVNITPGMKLCIASNTKTFMSVLLLKLQEMNVLSLDDSLDEWIPNFQHVDSTITIRQLLNHTSGVYNFTSYPGYSAAMNSDTGRFWTPGEVLTTFLSSPYFSPGQGYYYSNTNYILAGMIVKAATGTAVSNKLRELILNPHNITGTFLPPEENVMDTIAHGWENGIEISYPWTSWWSSVWTAGALYSKAEDLARFYKALFDLQIINQSSLNQMLTYTAQSNYSYGLGIARVLYQGRTKISHDGSWRGYVSIAGIDSAARYTISVLVNQRPATPVPFIEALDNAILNFITIGIAKISSEIPKQYSISQNYPNPFNPTTKIRMDIPAGTRRGAFVKMHVYDVLGREVAELVNEQLPPGTYEVEWDAANFSSGVYYYRLTSADFNDTKKMILLK